MMPSSDPQQPAVAFAAQLNYIEGGALLCVAFHHSVFDARGFATVLQVWATKARFGSSAGREDIVTITEKDLDHEQLKGHGCVFPGATLDSYLALSVNACHTDAK